MNNPYSSGTADWLYSGDKADLWVEYKYLPKLPVRAMILPDLSELQKDWLNGYYDRTQSCSARHVAVVVGCRDGAVIYEDREWLMPLTPEEFQSRIITRHELALWLVTKTKRATA